MKIRKKNIVETKITTKEEWNKEAGTLEKTTDINTTKLKAEVEPSYVKMYVDDISRLNGLPEYVNNILHELLRNMGYNNVIPMYLPIKQMICEKLSIPLNTLNKAIDELYKKGILIRKARGFYIMDPFLFGRGSWGEIKEIRLTIDYNNGKRELKADINKQIQLFEDESFSKKNKKRLD